MMNDQAKKGFTLVELLVVVLIIGILAAVALPQYQKAVIKARATEIKTFIANVDKAVNLYLLEHDGYPQSVEEQRIPWEDLSIDVSSFCTEGVGNASQNYKCTAKNWWAEGVVLYSRKGWNLTVYPNENVFGPSVIFYNFGNIGGKQCFMRSNSLKAKPMCDVITENDPTWDVREVGC